MQYPFHGKWNLPEDEYKNIPLWPKFLNINIFLQFDLYICKIKKRIYECKTR